MDANGLRRAPNVARLIRCARPEPQLPEPAATTGSVRVTIGNDDVEGHRELSDALVEQSLLDTSWRRGATALDGHFMSNRSSAG